MDFTLSPELKQLRARTRSLVDDVLQPLELEAEQNGGRLSAEAHAQVKRAVLASGLNAANIPTQYGGGGLNLTEQVVMHEQLGRLTNCLWVLVWSPSNVLVHGTPEQIERYLLPDARGIRAEAVRDGDFYRLSGKKWFVTDGDIASYFLVLAWAVDGLERQPTLFIVDKDLPGVEMTDDPDFTHNFPYRHPEY